MLRNILGQIFDSTLASFLTTFFPHFWTFSFFKICWNHYFYRFSANMLCFAHPQKLGTLFVNTTALTVFSIFFLHFCFGGFLLCPFVWSVFERNEKSKIWTQTTKKKQDHKMQTRKPLSLVYKERQQTTQTQNNATSLFRLQTSKTRNKKTRTNT